VFIEVEDMYRELLDSARITVLAENSVLYASQYWGIHGLSLLVEVYRGGVKRSILMDLGQDPQVLIHNMSVAGVDPGSIDAIVLSHCHYDHTGGVAEVVKRIGRRELPVIAHPSIFRVNLKTDPFLKYIGVRSGDSRDSIERSGGILVLSRDPVEIMPGVLTTGEVKRVFGFERVEGFKTTTESGQLVDDEMMDDTSLILTLRDGLVVLTGCAHAGICNIIKHSIELTGIKKLKAVIGGLHLVNADENRIKRTIDCLVEHNPELIATGHCTGFKAQVELYLKFRDKFKPLQTGLSITL